MHSKQATAVPGDPFLLDIAATMTEAQSPTNNPRVNYASLTSPDHFLICTIWNASFQSLLVSLHVCSACENLAGDGTEKEQLN